MAQGISGKNAIGRTRFEVNLLFSYCKLDGWRRLMDMWKLRRSAMVVREFEADGDDTDCACFRGAAIREAWQAEKDAAEERECPTTFPA
jgi:hypothetical protein